VYDFLAQQMKSADSQSLRQSVGESLCLRWCYTCYYEG